MARYLVESKLIWHAVRRFRQRSQPADSTAVNIDPPRYTTGHHTPVVGGGSSFVLARGASKGHCGFPCLRRGLTNSCHQPLTHTIGAIMSQPADSTMDMYVYMGIFPKLENAEAAIKELHSIGIHDERIGILTKHSTDAERFGLKNDPTHTHWEEGTAIGASMGALAGVGLTMLVASGAILGIGPVIAGGWLLSLIAGAGAGATTGTILGGLIGLGIPEDEATYCSEQVSEGKTVVAVQTDGTAPWVRSLYRKHGAVELK